MTQHCPDDKCHDKVEDMEDEITAIKVGSKFIKAIVWVFIPIIISVSGIALLVWSDSRAVPGIYATIKSVGESNDIINEKIKSIQIEQIELKINSEYTKKGVDDILKILGQMNRAHSKPINVK